MNIINTILSFDAWVQDLILNIRNEAVDNFFLIFTWLGNWIAVSIIFMFVSFLLYHYKKTEFIWPLVVALVGTGIMTVIIKFIVDRARPAEDIAVYVQNYPSFPSAHAALIIALFGFIIFCIWKLTWGLKIKIILSIFSILIIILVGFSRIYLGVHYISDVIAGYLTGLIWLIVAIYIL